MNTKKCDRCGKFFTANNEKFHGKSRCGIAYLLEGTFDFDRSFCRDLCGDCLKSLDEWFESNSPPSALAELSVDSMGLSGNIRNCLKRANIETVDDLVKMGRGGLKHVRGIGTRNYAEIARTLVNKYGQPPEDWEW